MKLRINFLNQIKALFDLILISCLFFVFWFFNLEIFDFWFTICLVLPFVIIFVVPVIIIHLNYYLVSNHFVYEIDREEFVIISNDCSKRYKLKDIDEVVIYMTPNRLKDNAIRNLPFENYYYCELKLSNGKKNIVTCLHSNKIDKLLEENIEAVKITKIKTFYPIIR